ncbi:SRPBCC family protein [Haloplanus sp. GCM10025708]|uniref:SRPBCC family protein n=1 Tax=Haloferacaceae TaxID=1644056 RepID=UPI00361476EA
MAVYERRTRVSAPLEAVWDFHSRPSGLEALTPEWLHLRVEAVRAPDGDTDPNVLVAGSRIRVSVRPFGVGPRRRWVSVITDRERTDGAAHFRDEMAEGPFARWVHTHRFFADGDETVVADRVDYRLPGGRVGGALSPLARVGFDPVFRYRHRKTRELLE